MSLDFINLDTVYNYILDTVSIPANISPMLTTERWEKKMATEKQVRYAIFLLGQKGYSTRFMDSSFKTLGATMRERSGGVQDWIKSMDMGRISRLIDSLKA